MPPSLRPPRKIPAFLHEITEWAATTRAPKPPMPPIGHEEKNNCSETASSVVPVPRRVRPVPTSPFAGQRMNESFEGHIQKRVESVENITEDLAGLDEYGWNTLLNALRASVGKNGKHIRACHFVIAEERCAATKCRMAVQALSVLCTQHRQRLYECTELIFFLVDLLSAEWGAKQDGVYIPTKAECIKIFANLTTLVTSLRAFRFTERADYRIKAICIIEFLLSHLSLTDDLRSTFLGIDMVGRLDILKCLASFSRCNAPVGSHEAKLVQYVDMLLELTLREKPAFYSDQGSMLGSCYRTFMTQGNIPCAVTLLNYLVAHIDVAKGVLSTSLEWVLYDLKHLPDECVQLKGRILDIAVLSVSRAVANNVAPADLAQHLPFSDDIPIVIKNALQDSVYAYFSQNQNNMRKLAPLRNNVAVKRSAAYFLVVLAKYADNLAPLSTQRSQPAWTLLRSLFFNNPKCPPTHLPGVLQVLCQLKAVLSPTEVESLYRNLTTSYLRASSLHQVSRLLWVLSDLKVLTAKEVHVLARGSLMKRIRTALEEKQKDAVFAGRCVVWMLRACLGSEPSSRNEAKTYQRLLEIAEGEGMLGVLQRGEGGGALCWQFVAAMSSAKTEDGVRLVRGLAEKAGTLCVADSVVLAKGATKLGDDATAATLMRACLARVTSPTTAMHVLTGCIATRHLPTSLSPICDRAARITPSVPFQQSDLKDLLSGLTKISFVHKELYTVIKERLKKR